MELSSLTQLRAVLGQDAVVVFFSGPDCGVCHVLGPKVAGLLRDQFPAVRYYEIDTARAREAAAQYGVFSVPTVIGWFEGRELVRLGGAFGLDQLRSALARPYALMFG
ncbi:MAG: thioredoxin family protein [Gammaproteobacteria bacterium]